MHVCVTGASGYIGSALVDYLYRRGDTVTAVSRNPGDGACTARGPRWIRHDLLHDPSPGRVLAEAEVVVHLAGLAHRAQRRHADPAPEYQRVNADGAERVARAAAANGVRRMVFVSSVGVHGSSVSTGGTVSESSPIGSEEAYAQSKIEAERRLATVARETGLEVVTIRPALVVGAAAPGNLQRLCRWVASRVPVPVPHADNQRSYVTLSNLLDLLAIASTHPAAAGEAFVAAEEECPPTPRILRWIAEGMRTTVRTCPVPSALLFVAAAVVGKAELYRKLYGSFRIDATKAREMLGWSSRESLASAFRALGSAHVRRTARSALQDR